MRGRSPRHHSVWAGAAVGPGRTSRQKTPAVRGAFPDPGDLPSGLFPWPPQNGRAKSIDRAGWVWDTLSSAIDMSVCCHVKDQEGPDKRRVLFSFQ